MGHPDGLNKGDKCSLLLKAVYISFQDFMERSLYCVTAEVLDSPPSQDRPFINSCCMGLRHLALEEKGDQEVREVMKGVGQLCSSPCVKRLARVLSY